MIFDFCNLKLFPKCVNLFFDVKFYNYIKRKIIYRDIY